MPRIMFLCERPLRASICGFAAALLLVTAGCGRGAEAPALPPDDTENYDGRVLSCPRPSDDRTPAGEDEFAVDYMTRKLHDFPALAAHAGLTEVTSCEEARAFAKAYREFAARTPDFDSVPATATARTASRAPLPRLKFSVPGPEGTGRLFESDYPRVPNPIVHIHHAAFARDGMNNLINEYCTPVTACTGTFIAKNWILTAAHCLQPAHLQSAQRVPPDGGACPDASAGPLPTVPGSTAFKGDANWVIRWVANKGPDKFSNPMGLSLRVRQLPHPQYAGVFKSNGSPLNNFDVALLYLPSANQVERFLPPNVDSGGAAFLSAAGIMPEEKDREHMSAGYGLPTPGFLKAGLIPKGSKTLFVDSTVGAEVTSAWNGVAPCPGDSGGPLYRVDEVVSGTAFPVVITGVLSGAVKANNPFFTTACPNVGDAAFWTRVENGNTVLSWINTEMRRYNGSLFSCRRQAGQNYLRCWGEPCFDDLSCPPDKVCRGAADEFRILPCSPEICGGGCSCIVGQCVPGIKKLVGP